MSDRSQPADVTRPSYCSGNEVASISWQRQGQGTTYLSTTSTSTHGRFQSTRERRSANNGAVRRSNSTASAQGQGRDSTLSRLRSSEGESAVPRLYPGLKGRRNVDFFHLRQGMNPAAHRQQPSMPEPQEQQRSSQESTLLDEPNAVDGHDVAHQRSEFDTTTGEASTGIAVAATSTSFDQTTERRTGDEDFTGTTDATTGTVNATEVSADIPSLTSYEDKNKLQQSDPPSRDLPVSSGHSSAIAAGVTPSSPLNAGVHHQQQQSTPSETPDLSGAFSTTSTSTVSVPGASFNADNSMYVRKAGLGGGRRSSETANNLQQQTPPSLQRYASVGTGDSSIRTPGLRRFQSVGGATGSNEGGSPHPRRVPGLRRRESIESGALGTISGDNNPIGPREPNFRRHESVGNSTISTVSTVSTVSNGGGGASVPGASFSTDNGFIARKAALSMRRSRMEDTSMDGSSYSIDSMNASMVSVPGASFSTDNGAYARKAGLRGRASVRSNRSFSSGASSASSGAMEDESSRSMPGASRENDGEQASAKEGKHMARSQDSLRTVDENIKMRGAGGTPNSSFRYQPGSSIRSVGSGTQTMQGREDSYRAQMDGSIGTATTDHNIEELEERYRAKVGAESRPGAVSSNDTQAADAINAKLERHFGPTLESQEQERGDRFSHISLLSPRRPESTTLSLPPTISIRASVEEDEVSEELDREEFDMEFEAEVVPVARSQGNLPRELTVDQDVAREQATFPIGDNKERLWFFTPTGIGVTCAIVVVAIIAIVAAVATRSKGSDEVNYDEVIADAGLPFTNTLPSATQAILEEQDPDAPQYMAYQWLQEEDLFLGYPLWRKQQRFAMATIYFALYHSEEDQDMPWFEHDTDECDWLWSVDDLSKCDSSGRYEILSLRLDYRGSGDEILVNGCRGPNDNCTVAENGSPPRHEIPPEIGLLSIEQLNVAHVKSTTPLSNIWPAELFNLTNSLVQLTAKESRGLTGTIPTFVGLLSNLEVLSVEQTSVTGGIPTQIGECRNLQELIVSENPSLSGRLPTELGIMSNLELMWIFDNQNLTGPVPSEFGTMPNLLFLSLDGNDLTSTIPTELGLATTLNEFRLGRNDLSGTVPSELGALSNLRTFALQDNDKLSGTMPLLLCKLDILMFQYFVDCTRIECCTSY
ncbi:LRR receptor-like serine threonine-protein kinase [Seminavis robusta]|uniref:LRR receptor-like serine threonine-protein kinase n=1 Tax=Seminavis robusta TaxID=568900 RepID=A0A9N8H1Q3_9STRA|nr:LRR receptor-like serine threonine-protein kinase [Seminavis robusta]|eukprot:Sro46_g027400.1 LRR receptor-like serine threonine-protein kinase (1162) ;mRNA; r:56315-60089